MNARNDQSIEVSNEQAEDVEEFVYMGALLDKEGGATQDIQHILSKARQAFYGALLREMKDERRKCNCSKHL